MWLYIGQIVWHVIELVFTILFDWEEGGKSEKTKRKKTSNN